MILQKQLWMEYKINLPREFNQLINDIINGKKYQINWKVLKRNFFNY